MTPLLFALATPWAVGPSPAAQEVHQGVVASAEASMIATADARTGGRLALGASPHPRLWSELSVQQGSSWQMCTDCQARASDLKVRGTLIRHRAFNLTPWAMGSATPGALDGTLGAALEGGTSRVRFDTTWPIVTSHEKLVSLRIMPETGVSAVWSAHHATRFAVVGLEPAFALQHRVRIKDQTVVATVRLGEEGPAGQLGLQWAF